MTSNMRQAWAAETFAAESWRKHEPSSLVVPLAPSFPCDLLVVDPRGGGGANLVWLEVKSSRNRARAKKARLTAPEEAFRERVRHGEIPGSLHAIVRLHAKPKKGGWTFEEVFP